MRELRTEIEINASAEKVWRMLIDFDAYPEWNPFIRSIEGKPLPDYRLSILVQPSGAARGMRFKPIVLKVEPEKELRWLGSLIVRGLFDGEHIFTIAPVSETKVRFLQREKFSGLLVPLFWRSLDVDTRRGFNEMNAALKQRAESGNEA
jgi:hypothetical protein